MSQRNKRGEVQSQPTTKQYRCWQIKTGKGNRERIVEGGGSANRRVEKRNGRKEYSRREMHKRRKQQKRSRKSPPPGQPVSNRTLSMDKLDSTPPPLRGTGRSPPPSGWEVLFNLFLDDLPRGRDGGFLNDKFDSGCLGTIDPDRGRELNGCGDGCDTGIRWSRATEHW